MLYGKFGSICAGGRSGSVQWLYPGFALVMHAQAVLA